MVTALWKFQIPRQQETEKYGMLPLWEKRTHGKKLLASGKLPEEHLDMLSTRCSLSVVNAKLVELIPALSGDNRSKVAYTSGTINNQTLNLLLDSGAYIYICICMYMCICVYIYIISLSTIVLNSRDWSEIVWLPEILRFKINLAISFIRKNPLECIG